MKGKKVTFMVVGNGRGGTRRWVVPVGLMRLGFIMSLLFVVCAVALLVDYANLMAKSLENKKLRAQNAILQEQFQIVENKLGALETGLDRVRVLSTKLKLITNIDDDDRALKLAVGPDDRQAQAFSIDEEETHHALAVREPASQQLPQEDEIFFEQPPLDERKGDIELESKTSYATLAVRIDRTTRESQLREQGLMDLWERLSERQSLLNATPSISPVRGGWFSSRFGYRLSPFFNRPIMHNGIDIAAAPGTPVYAPADGVVSYAGYNSSYGKMVSIDHGYGVVTRFAHNSRLFVQVGEKVSRWDVIAAVGNTGRSTGPHLHYEVRINDIPVDPNNYILDR